MSAMDISVNETAMNKSGMKGKKKGDEKPQIPNEELLKSDSESYKAIFALVKLFMSKSAHSSLTTREDHQGDPLAERNYNNYVIIQAYIDRLRVYSETRIEPTNTVSTRSQQMRMGFGRLNTMDEEANFDATKFRHAKFQKYIMMMTIMTNCLTSKHFVRELL